MARYGRSFPAPPVILRRSKTIASVAYVATESAGAGSTNIVLANAANLAGDLVCCFAVNNSASARTWQSPLTNDNSGTGTGVGWGLGHGIIATPTDTVSVNAGTTRLRATLLRFASSSLDAFDINSGTGTSASVADPLALTDSGGMVISYVFVTAADLTISDPANLPVNFHTGSNTMSIRGNRTADGGHGVTGDFTPDTFTWTGSQNWVRLTIAAKTA